MNELRRTQTLSDVSCDVKDIFTLYQHKFQLSKLLEYRLIYQQHEMGQIKNFALVKGEQSRQSSNEQLCQQGLFTEELISTLHQLIGEI